MISRPPFRRSQELFTESVTVALPLDAKQALAQVARRSGKSVSTVVREAVQDVLQRDNASSQKLSPKK